MLFKKLFQLLVLGGAVVGTGTGCNQSAQAQTGMPKKAGMADAGTAADAGTTAGGGAMGW